MNAQLRDVPEEKLRIGLPVCDAFETVKEGLTLYIVLDSSTPAHAKVCPARG